MKTIAQPSPVCPYCGATMTDAWELALEDGDQAYVECEACAKLYMVVKYVTTYYSTAKVEEKK